MNIKNQVIESALNLPAANVCQAYVLKENGAIVEVDITPQEFVELAKTLPVTYHEPGYRRFDIDEQIAWHEEELRNEADFLMGTGRM